MLYLSPSGDAPVCDPRLFYECLTPRLHEYVRNNEASKCRCPRRVTSRLYDAMLQPVCNVPVQASDVHGDQTFKTETEFSRPRERDSDPTSDTETETEISASTSVSGPHFWGLIYNYKISYDNLTIIVRWSHKIFCKSGPWSRDRDWDRNFNVCGKGAVDLIIKMFPPLFTPLLRTLPITVCIETKLTSIPIKECMARAESAVVHASAATWCTTTPSGLPRHRLMYHYTICSTTTPSARLRYLTSRCCLWKTCTNWITR